MRRCASGLLLGVSLLAVFLALFPAPALAEAADDRLFREANRAYASGRYAEARERYEQLVQKGYPDAALHCNLGNAYFRLNELGRAIWAFERALGYDPEIDEAKHNLSLARETAHSRVKDKVVGVQKEPLRIRIVRAFSVNGATIWFLLTWYLALGVFTAVLLVRPGVLRSLLVAVGVLGAVVALGFGLIYYGRVELEKGARQAIVLPDMVAVREGPRGIAVKTFEIHAGLKVTVADREDQWVKIRLTNGLEGWVPAGSVGEL